MMDFDGLCAYVKVHFPNSFSIGEPMKDHTTFAIGRTGRSICDGAGGQSAPGPLEKGTGL